MQIIETINWENNLTVGGVLCMSSSRPAKKAIVRASPIVICCCDNIALSLKDKERK